MNIAFDRDDLRPLIEFVVAQMLDRFGDAGRVALNETEAAAALGIDRDTLGAERRAGHLAAAKIGRGYVYDRAELVAFVQRRKGGGE